MKLTDDNTLFAIVLSAIVLSIILAKIYFPSSEEIETPFIASETSALVDDANPLADGSNPSHSSEALKLMEEFNQNLDALKKMGEHFTKGLLQMQPVYQECHDTESKAVCDDFLVKQQRLRILGNAVISEHQHIERLMEIIRLKFSKEKQIDADEEVPVREN